MLAWFCSSIVLALCNVLVVTSMEKYRKPLLLVCKLAFTAFAVWVLVHQLDLSKLRQLLTTAHIGWVALAFVLLNLAQLASALRMRYYFFTEGVRMPYGDSIGLYYVGMLFNHVLPGGIGGDGYKAYAVRRDYDFPLSSAIRLMICNRASGLLFLILIGLGFGFFSEGLRALIPYTPLLLTLAAIITTGSYAVLARLLLKEPYATQRGAALYSFFVQGLVALCAACLFESFSATYPWHQAGHTADYLMLFMIACFVSVLPVSLGGLGLRELTFFFGAQYLGLNAEAGVAVSLLYFTINLTASLLGAVYFLKGKRKKD